MFKIALFTLLILLSINLYAHCCPGTCCKPDDTSLILNNKAIANYCPGWCCPDIADDEALRDAAWQYCKHHPNATKPSKELQMMFDVDSKNK
jgi:hypothetical protein